MASPSFPDPLTDADGFSCAQACRRANVSRETFQRLSAYAQTLDQWRDKTNLIGPAERTRLWRRHVYDSLRLLPYIRKDRPATLLDLGAGAGFPGLILACALADESAPICVTLIEAHARRAAFLRAAASACHVSVQVLNTRIEQAETPVPFDYVTARALAPLPRLLALAAKFVSLDSLVLFPKGRNVSIEIERASNSWSFSLDIKKHSDGGVILSMTHMTPRTRISSFAEETEP